MNAMLKNLLIFFFCGSGLLFAQENKTISFDSVNKQIVKLRKEGKLKEALLLCENTIQNSGKTEKTRELILLHIVAGNLLSNLSRFQESFNYLDTVMKSDIANSDTEIKARIYIEYGRNYSFLGFHDKALENYNKSIDYMTSTEDSPQKKKYLQYIYGLRASIFEQNGQENKNYNELSKAYKINPNPLFAARIAKHFILTKNLDSARYYLDQGTELYDKGTFPIHQKSILLKNYGKYYIATKNYSKALLYLEESLGIMKKVGVPEDLADLYKVMYEVRLNIKNDDKSTEYLKKYSEITDSLVVENKKAREIPLKHFVAEKESKFKSNTNNLYYIIAILLIISVILFIVYKKVKLKKHVTLEQLTEKEQTVQELEQKVNEAFEEVAQLAKNNSPEFLTRFDEVYPEFSNRLKDVYPDIGSEELRFCALLKLNFSTKDIAKYTFVTVRAVQTRKSRLRKKLNIPSEEDIYLWMNK